jgi:hypothetical protein
MHFLLLCSFIFIFYVGYKLDLISSSIFYALYLRAEIWNII